MSLKRLKRKRSCGGDGAVFCARVSKSRQLMQQVQLWQFGFNMYAPDDLVSVAECWSDTIVEARRRAKHSLLSALMHRPPWGGYALERNLLCKVAPPLRCPPKSDPGIEKEPRCGKVMRAEDFSLQRFTGWLRPLR